MSNIDTTLFEGIDPTPYGRVPLTPAATGLSGHDIDRARGLVHGSILPALPIKTSPTNGPISDIVFDFGGVLANWDITAALVDDYNASLVAQFADTAISSVWTAFRLTDRGWADQSGIDLVSRHNPLFGDMLAFVYKHFDLTSICETPGSRELVEMLHERGYRLWGLSNWSPENFQYVYQRIPSIHMLDGFIVSGFVHCAKPEQEIYHLAEQRFPLVPSHTVFVDDNTENVETARKRGWHAILRTGPGQLISSLRALKVDIPAPRKDRRHERG